MPTITGSQLAKTYALAGKMRAGAARAGFTSSKLFVAIGAVQYATARLTDANKVLDGTLTITDVLNETPNTAALTMMGAEPAEGSDVVITLGSTRNGDRLFAGTVINRSHGYIGTPAFWQAPINVVDYTWHLTRRRVSGSYTNTAPSVIAAAIVAAVPGFTVSVAAGLPTLDTFSYTDVDALSALTQLAGRCGGYVDVDYLKVVKLFITDATVTAPTALTPTHPTLTAFSYTKDLSQVRTRIFVEGGGVTALAYGAAGETMIPVETAAWYSALGGTVKSGAQHVTYTGVQAGGTGSLVGPGASPSSAPAVVATSGAGVTSGLHGYAVTYVTASGESIAGPTVTITAGPTAVTPPAAPTATHWLGSGTYYYAVTFVDAAGETLTSALYFAGTSNGTGYPLQFVTGPAGTTARRLYRTVTGGAQLKLLVTVADNTTTSYLDSVADGALGANAPTAGTLNVMALTGIPLGPAAVTSRKVYRTAAAAAQLKLLTTIADNTTTIYTDSTADGSLGANVPTSDTSALTQPSGQVLAGASSLLVAAAGGNFATAGGWAVIGNGTQVVRYTGITTNTLTGIPAIGPGAITATVSYNSTVTASPALIGIPASGAGSISYPILPGDPVNLLVQVDDTAAQTALAALMGGTDDGVVEGYLQDGTIGLTEATARGNAKLAQCSRVRISIAYDVRDKNSRAGRTVHVALTSPTSITGDFMIQSVTIDTFSPALMPTFHVQASSDRFSLEDLLRVFRKQAA